MKHYEPFVQEVPLGDVLIAIKDTERTAYVVVAFSERAMALYPKEAVLGKTVLKYSVTVVSGNHGVKSGRFTHYYDLIRPAGNAT